MSTFTSHTPSLPDIRWKVSFPLAVWSIWSARNKLVMENHPFEAHRIIERIKALAQELFHFLPPTNALMRKNLTHVGWKPPPLGFYKLHTDGSARGNPGRASAGGLLRDHNGAWIGSFSRDIGYTHSMAAELWGLRDGLMLARTLNINKIMIEVDAQNVLNMVKPFSAPANHTHPYINLINDCRSILQSFEVAHIDHTHRKGNHCADILAKVGLNNSNALVLHSCPPSCILYQLLADAWGVVYPRLCNS